MKCVVWLVLLAIFPALSHLTTRCDPPPMPSLLLWPQITRARGRKGEKTQSKNAVPRPSEEQSLRFPTLVLRQTVPELHSRRRNRGPLEPTLLSQSPPPSSFIPSVSTAVVSLLTPSLTLSLVALFLSPSLHWSKRAARVGG